MKDNQKGLENIYRDVHGRFSNGKGIRYWVAQALVLSVILGFPALIVGGLLKKPVAGAPVHAAEPAVAGTQGAGNGEGGGYVYVNCARGKQGLGCDLTEADVAEKARLVAKWYSNAAAEAKPVQSAYHLPAKGFRKLTGDRLEVAGRIVSLAREEKFADAGYLLALADCESSFTPSASNAAGNSPKGSRDRGLYMFNDYWQKGVTNACAYDAECATRTTIGYLKAGRQSLWACDRIIRKDGRLAAYRKAYNK